jgi:hypothetical protein
VCARCHLSTRYDTPEHHHHEADTQGAACVSCHMPERIYMVNDLRADHSMRVPRPDLTVSIGTPNACTGCHQDQPPPGPPRPSSPGTRRASTGAPTSARSCTWLAPGRRGRMRP